VGWILLDGCRVSDGQLPILAILEPWRAPGEPIDAIALTHPHRDHAFGIREVIETTAPRRIGLTTSVTDPGLVFAAVTAAVAGTDPLDRLHRRTVVDAMLAIQRRFVAAPAEILPLVDGTHIPLSNANVVATVRAPDGGTVHARLAGGGTGDPNELSAVVELNFGATRIVFDSDLPTVGSNGASLGAGWNTVMTRHPHLSDHTGLKIPHHGSPAAFHAALMTTGSGRPWWISPFNQGVRLPPVDPDGLPRLVGLNGAVSLTGTPHRRSAQAVHPDPALVTLAELPTLFAPGQPILPGGFSVTPPSVQPLDPLWCAAFDDQGVVRGAWRGNRAYTVVP
jgi:hypothetical protein